jgi:hypothetical protein
MGGVAGHHRLPHKGGQILRGSIHDLAEANPEPISHLQPPRVAVCKLSHPSREHIPPQSHFGTALVQLFPGHSRSSARALAAALFFFLWAVTQNMAPNQTGNGVRRPCEDH